MPYDGENPHRKGVAMKSLRLALLFSIALLPLRAVDPALLNLARPDANLVMGIDVTGFTSSALFQEALRKAESENADLQSVMGLLGPNIFQNLHEIIIAARIDQFDKATKPKNFLIAARGSFGGNMFTDLLCQNGCEREDYRDLQLLKFSPKSGEEDVYFAALDSQYAAMGSYVDVRQAVDRRAMGAHSVLDATLQSSITRLSPYHFWLTTQGLVRKGLEGVGNPMMPPGTAAKVDGLGLGIRLENDLDLALEILSVSDQDAKQLYDMANGFLALMKAGETASDTAEILNSLQLRQDPSVLIRGRSAEENDGR